MSVAHVASQQGLKNDVSNRMLVLITSPISLNFEHIMCTDWAAGIARENFRQKVLAQKFCFTI